VRARDVLRPPSGALEPSSQLKKMAALSLRSVLARGINLLRLRCRGYRMSHCAPMLLSVPGLRMLVSWNPVQSAAIALVARCTWVRTCCSSDFIAIKLVPLHSGVSASTWT
jgi:hypothetical protein